MKPLVSIITPVFNGKRYIEECIESALKQNYENVEHVIIDGASTDGTVEIIEGYASRYPDRVRYVSEPDSGIAEAWNKGFRLVRGDVIGWLGFDDMLSDAEALSEVMIYFVDNEDAVFVHGSCHVIDEDGEIITTHRVREFTLHDLINKDNYISCPAAFYRKRVVDTVGDVDEKASDLDYMIRIAKEYPVHRIDKVLARFRVRSDSVTGSIDTFMKDLKWDYQVMRKHGGTVLSKRARRYYMFCLLNKAALLPLMSQYRKANRRKQQDATVIQR